MYQIIYDGFVLPFRNMNLIGFYIGLFLAVFSLAFIEVAFSISLVSMGLEELMSYFLARIAGMNLLMMPFSFFLLRRLTRGQSVAALWSMSIIGAVALFVCGVDLHFLLTGFLLAVVVCPFWSMFHLAMFTHSSDENRGNELGMAHLWMTFGALVGSACGGYATTLLALQDMMLLSNMLTHAALAVMVLFCLKTGVFKVRPANDPYRDSKVSFLHVIMNHRERSFATFMSSMHSVPTNTLWPVWLKIIGAGAVAVGLLNAVKIGLKFLLSPIAGKLINLKSGTDSRLGASLHIIGWMPWFFSINPMTSLVSSAFFASGEHLFEVGIQSRWYEQKSYSQMAAREVLLACGRIVGAGILLPLMFYSTQNFVVGATTIAFVLLLSGMLLSRSLKVALEPVTVRADEQPQA